MELEFTTRIFREGRTFVAHAMDLDVSSCGGTKEMAIKNVKEAVRIFLEEAGRMGTLQRILQEAGYSQTKKGIAPPEFIGVRRMSLHLPPAHAEN